MSSEGNHSKKRKCHDIGDGDCSNVAGASSPPEEAMTMDAMRAEMEQMKTEMQHRTMADEIRKKEMDELFAMMERMKIEHAREIKSLEGRCELLGRSVQLLKNESKWEYSAPEIPMSHWIEQGHDENQAMMMEDFASDLKIITRHLRAEGYEHDGLFMGGYNLEGVEEDNGNSSVTRVLHDDRLLPHWKEFAIAVQIAPIIEDGVPFSLSHVDLPTAVIEILAPALKAKPFEEFELRDIGFVNSREGIGFAVEVIKSNTRLKKFEWVENRIGSMADVKNLVEGIASNDSIVEVNIESCCGGGVNGREVLCSLLQGATNLTSISLSSNGICNIGSCNLPDVLAANPPLRELDLRNNHLDDDDAALIATALKDNTNLKELNLEGNHFTMVGYSLLQTAVFDSTTFKAMSDANHTCIIYADSRGFLTGCNSLFDEAHENRAHKIYALLSDIRNLRELDLELGDDSLSLVPMVLACVQKYSLVQYEGDAGVAHYKPPLSVTYGFLRVWKMPELFERRNA